MAIQKFYQRWDIHQRLQHILMGIGFIICAVTGLTIKFHTAIISINIAMLFGGYDGLIFWHKIGAIIVLGVAFYHLLYLLHMGIVKRKPSWVMVPTLQDGKDIVNGIRHSFGFEKQKPEFGRYSWKEKFDYLAVFWGMMAIGVTGIFMWFPELAASFMPRWAINSMRMAHSDEAVLAVTFILFWHFYNVHFSADIFPMNKVWLTGKLTEEEMKHEHPLELMQIKMQDKEVLKNIENYQEGESTEKPHNSKWLKNRKFLITQFISWFAILIWFLAIFIPHGLK